MSVPYFTEEAYERLRNFAPENMEHYICGDDWLDAFFGGQEYQNESSINVSLPQMVPFSSRLSVEERTREDIANVKQIYGNMRSLSPLQATNPYMWTCLAHVVYPKYVVHRWFDDEGFDSLSEEKKRRRVQLRYFATGNERSLNDNAISRLWWYGFISYDSDNRGNPFHLTEVLVSNTKFCTDFMLSHCCWNRTVGRGVLRAAADIIPTLSGKEGISGYYRPLKKYLNRYGAVSSLDFLSEDDVYSLSMEFIQSQRKTQPIMIEDDDMDVYSDDQSST